MCFDNSEKGDVYWNYVPLKTDLSSSNRSEGFQFEATEMREIWLNINFYKPFSIYKLFSIILLYFAVFSQKTLSF